MRALASVIVVCLVAATGAHPAAAAQDRRPTLEVFRSRMVLRARLVESVASGSTTPQGVRRAPLPAGSGGVLAILASDAAPLASPAAWSIERIADGSRLVAFCWLSTRSARGPPVV